MVQGSIAIPLEARVDASFRLVHTPFEPVAHFTYQGRRVDTDYRGGFSRMIADLENGGINYDMIIQQGSVREYRSGSRTGTGSYRTLTDSEKIRWFLVAYKNDRRMIRGQEPVRMPDSPYDTPTKDR